MKNLKTVLSVLVAMTVLFSLSGCKKVDKDYGKSSEKKTVSSSVSSVAEESQETPIMSSDRIMSNFFDISLFDEENYSEIYLGKKFKISAEIDGCTMEVPSKLDTLQKNGWALAEGNEYDAGSLVFSYETVKTVMQNQNGVKITADFYNSSRYSLKLSECNLVKIRVENNYYQNRDSYTHFDINGINNTMAVTDVIDILGTPSHFYAVSDNNYYLDYFISRKDRRNGITVYVNPEDDSITQVEFSTYK